MQSPFVFVSYAHQDYDVVKKIIGDLEKHGINTWFDKRGIKAGTPDWDSAIRQAIRSSSALLYVASPRSALSTPVFGEILYAEKHKRMIYPVWIEGDKWIDVIPLILSRYQYIDLRDSNHNAAFNELIQLLKDTINESVSVQETEGGQSQDTIDSLVNAGDFGSREHLVKLLKTLDGLCLPDPDGASFRDVLFNSHYALDKHFDALFDLDLIVYEEHEYIPSPEEQLWDNYIPEVLGCTNLSDLGKQIVKCSN